MPSEDPSQNKPYKFLLSSSFSFPSTSFKSPSCNQQLLDEIFKKASRRTIAVINLKAVNNNINILQSLANDNTGIIAVVKGAAYGSGILPVVETVIAAGAKELAVAAVSEGVYLRKSGITVPINILGNLNTEELPDILEHNLYPTISWDHCIKNVPQSSLKYPNGSPLEVHIEIDTAMSRFGVQPSDLPKLVQSMKDHSVKIRSFYTHFQSSITSYELNKLQVEMFNKAVSEFPNIPLHAAATTGCVQGLGTMYDFIRPGGSVTGLCSGSSEEDVKLFAQCGFQPAFSVLMKPSFYKLLEANRNIGYDGTYTTQGEEWIANFNVGWSDGLARKLTNTGYVKRIKTDELCPIVGRVSMDSITVKVSSEPSLEEVFALITDDFHPITSAVGISRTLGAAVYEIPGNFSNRLPKVFIAEDEVKTVYEGLSNSN